MMENPVKEKPLQHMRKMLGRRQPPVFVTSSIVLLLLAERPAHGYALFKEMCDMGVYDDGVDPSAVYPTLKGSGPPRKVFRITGDGRRALEDFVEGHLLVMASDIEYFHRRYEATKNETVDRRVKAGSAGTKKGKAGSR